MFSIKDLNVGDTFHNENGDDYCVVAKNEELDRVLLVQMSNGSVPFYVGAYCIHKHSWSQGHYFMNNLKAAYNYVFEKEKKERKIEIESFSMIQEDVEECGYRKEIETFKLELTDEELSGITKLSQTISSDGSLVQITTIELN